MSFGRSLSILLLAPVAATVIAQAPARPAPTGEIRGKLTGPTGQPIQNASITVRAGTDTAFAGGTLPRPDGTFIADGLRAGTYAVRIRAIGFTPVIRTGIVVSAAAPADLGTVALQALVTNLAEQVVTADRDAVTLAPERNSYSVKGMATVAGGNAVDALRNVPSVEVDASNRVSLRGNDNVVVQINGRTSPLRGDQLGTFLTQIPAATLTRIEVTTSPSAREDPEGTAGIINIVLSQEVEGSRTAGFSLGTGSTRLATGSANAGIQTGKWTLFSSASASNDPRPFTGLSSRTNGVPTNSFSSSNLVGESAPVSQTFIGRSEYKATKLSSISFDAMASRSRQGRDNLSHFTTLDANQDTTGQFEAYTTSTSHNTMQDYNLAFRRQGPKVSQFSAEARYTQMGIVYGNVRALDPGAPTQTTLLDSLAVRFPTIAFQSDFSRPLKGGGKFDLGVKWTERDLASSTEVMDVDAAGTVTPQRAGSIDYKEQIQAAYGMAAQQMGKAQLQLGVRVEDTQTRLGLASRPADITDRYFSFFPNGAFTYALNPSRQLRASYSRRITRPQAGQLDPVDFYETSQMVFRGNPDLKAEYTDAYEFGFQETAGWGSLQVNPYYRHTNDAMRSIRTVDSDGVTISTFANAATVQTVGADINSNLRRGKLSLAIGGGLFDYRSEAGVLSTRTVSGNARVVGTYLASSKWDGQAQLNYQAAQGVEGGTRLANVNTALALRRKIRGDANVVSLRMVDLFNTARFRVRTQTGAVTENLERRFGQRGVFLTWSRTFGQQLRLRPRQEIDPASQLGGGPPG